MTILTDADVVRVLTMDRAIEAVEVFFRSAADGGVIDPARTRVVAGNGGLTFTIGAEMQKTHTIGFRVYPTYPTDTGTRSDQIVAVYSTNGGALKGLIIGSILGAIRTAAIGGVAAKYLSRPHPESATIVGAGFQARYQVEALMAVRKPRRLLVASRTRFRADELALRVSRKWPDVSVAVTDDVTCAVREADIVLCATSSAAPVLRSEWIKPGAYVASIGPKFAARHELPDDILSVADVAVSDATVQIEEYRERYFLSDTSSIIDLETIVRRATPLPDTARTVFLSTGRAGTEVVVADAALDAAERIRRGTDSG